MTVDISRSPFAVKYRELYLARGINEQASLPSSRYDGHPLAFTGARRGTTCDGVHFDGMATSLINLGVIHNAAAKLYISLRFKLDRPFAAGGVSQFLFLKQQVWDTDYILISLDTANGRLWFRKKDANVFAFQLSSTQTTWNAGQWYHALASISSIEGARLLIDNAQLDTDADVSAVCNGGNVTIGGFGAGAVALLGVMDDVFIEEGLDLTAVQEEDLYRGIPPATVDNAYPLDEGRGVIAYDRGADGNNGTLDTTATWAWGRVKQPVISFDGINDIAISSAGVDISGAVTIVWAGKLKAIYDGLSNDHYFVEYFIDNTNNYTLYLNSITGDIRFLCVAAGTNAVADLNAFGIEIDDYAIFIGTVTAAGQIQLFANGRLHATDTGLAPIAAGGVITYVGAEDSPAYYDVSKPLMLALIEGVFDQAQALEYSRFLDKVFNLGVVQ